MRRRPDLYGSARRRFDPVVYQKSLKPESRTTSVHGKIADFTEYVCDPTRSALAKAMARIHAVSRNTTIARRHPSSGPTVDLRLA